MLVPQSMFGHELFKSSMNRPSVLPQDFTFSLIPKHSKSSPRDQEKSERMDGW